MVETVHWSWKTYFGGGKQIFWAGFQMFNLVELHFIRLWIYAFGPKVHISPICVISPKLERTMGRYTSVHAQLPGQMHNLEKRNVFFA